MGRHTKRGGQAIGTVSTGTVWGQPGNGVLGGGNVVGAIRILI
jgi:hypothetical protein